jgi:hypothetical protein
LPGSFGALPIDARKRADSSLSAKPNSTLWLFHQALIRRVKWLFTGQVFTQNSIVLRMSE